MGEFVGDGEMKQVAWALFGGSPAEVSSLAAGIWADWLPLLGGNLDIPVSRTVVGITL
jgi:hypothetical protein